MVSGVAVIGAVAAIVSLAVTLRVVREEELAFETAAASLEQRLDLHLAAIATQLVVWMHGWPRCLRPQSMILIAGLRPVPAPTQRRGAQPGP